MKPLPVAALMALGLMTGSGQAAEVAFRPAVHQDWHRQIRTAEGENAIAFRGFFEIDWEQQAKRHFTAYPLAGLSKAQIQELAEKSVFGNTSVDFQAPLSEAYKTARFLFLSDDGSRELEAAALKGTVRYTFDSAGTGIERVTFYGSVIGVPRPNNVASGGFVALLANGQELARENLLDGKTPQLEAVNPYPKLKIKRQIRYRFEGAGATYLSVQFDPDTACEYACCAFSYLLFREDPKTGALAQLQSSLYGCDV
jgi:hypothetical protein